MLSAMPLSGRSRALVLSLLLVPFVIVGCNGGGGSSGGGSNQADNGGGGNGDAVDVATLKMTTRAFNQQAEVDWEASPDTNYTLYWSTDPDFTLENAAQAENAGSAQNVEPPYLVTGLDNRTNWYFIVASDDGDAVSPVRGAMPAPLLINGGVGVMHEANQHLYIGGNFNAVYHQTEALALVQRSTGAAAESLGVTGNVLTVVAHDDGWLVGGWLEYKGRQHAMLRVGPDLRVDEDWLIESDGYVEVIHVTDDRIYLGGRFAEFNGEIRRNLAALERSNGALVSGFSPDPNNTVRAIQRLGDYLYVAGAFTQIESRNYSYVARLDLDGYATVLPGDLADLRVGSQDIISMAAFQGRLFVGGMLENSGPGFPRHLLAFDAAGKRVDFDAGLSSSGYVSRLAVEGDHLYINGFLRGDVFDRDLVRLDQALDWSPVVLGSGVDVSMGGGLQFANDHLYFVGDIHLSDDHVIRGVAEIDLASGEITDFRVQPSAGLSAFLPVSPDLFLGATRLPGSIANGMDLSRFAVIDDTGNVRRDIDLRPMNGNSAGTVTDIASDAQGNVYVVGQFDRVLESGVSRISIASLTPDGALRSGWASNISRESSAVPAVYAATVVDDRVFIGGNFTRVDGVSRPALAALHAATGSVDSSFNPGVSGTSANQLHYMAAADALFVTGLDDVGGEDVSDRLFSVVALGNAPTISLPERTTTVHRVAAFSSDGDRLFIGGSFQDFDETGLDRAVRFLLDDDELHLDNAWEPAPDGSINGAVYHRGALWVAGVFNEIAGQPQGLLAPLAEDGSLDHGRAPEVELPSFSPQMSTVVGFGDYVCYSGYIERIGGVLTPGRFGCIDADTGELAW